MFDTLLRFCLIFFKPVDTLYRKKPMGFNLLKPTGYMMHQQAQDSRTVRSVHTVFMFYIILNKAVCPSALKS